MNFYSNEPESELTLPPKHSNVILVHPPHGNKLNQINILIQNTTQSSIHFVPQIECSIENSPEKHHIFESIRAYQNLESENEDDEFQLENESVSSKKRAKRDEKLKEIDQTQVDHGRGGNCVASNVCKTLFRIVLAHLNGKRLQTFSYFIHKYQIKSQKENSVIIMMLLHIFGRQQRLGLQMYEHIVNQFHNSLKESEHNCQRKMKEEEIRKSFHGKNRRMYKMFGEINKEIYQKSVSNLKFEQAWPIKELEEIVSNSYDRKQREVEKAMNKIKSIILNHQELKQWFDLWEIDIEAVFFEAIDFAYRRNLPKRCKQIKETAKSLIQKIKAERDIETADEKYMMCYMALKLMKEKETEVWSEFITNLYMKQQHNKSELERQKLRVLLEKEIPLKLSEDDSELSEGIKLQYKREIQAKRLSTSVMTPTLATQGLQSNDYENKCKIEEEETSDVDPEQIQVRKDKKPFGSIYKELRQTIDF